MPSTQRRRPSNGNAAKPDANQARQQSYRDTARVEFQPMPELSTEQYDALRADIEANGVLVPIVVDQHGRVLDGHDRKAIAAELGIDCPTEIRHVADDGEAADLAVTLNCARRHLNREQTREIIGAEVERRPDDSDRAIARRLGCSPTTVGMVRSLVSKLDGPGEQPPQRPPRKPRRSPLPERYSQAVRELAKSAERLQRIHADDRLSANRKALRMSYEMRLLNLREILRAIHGDLAGKTCTKCLSLMTADGGRCCDECRVGGGRDA